MIEDTLSFGAEFERYEWKHIEIDYHYAIPIVFNGERAGAMLPKTLKSRTGIEIIEVHGIEVYPEYRRKGIAEVCVKMMLEQCDMLIGCITEDQPKPFWQAMGAEFRPIPLDCFGRTLSTVHTEEPVFFFIAKNDEARKEGEKYGAEMPGMMRAFNKLPPEVQRSILSKNV